MNTVFHFLHSAIGTLLTGVGGLAVVAWGARRFAREQQRRGRWDEHGPLEESEPPPIPTKGYGMQERLEVIGAWEGERRKRERPTDRPSSKRDDG